MNALELDQRFREVIFNGRWIANTNFKNELECLDWEIASRKMGNHNTIALLTQHIHYYIKGVLQVFKGGNLEIKDQYSFEFSTIESQEDWQNRLSDFWNDAEEYAKEIEKLSDEKLKTPFVKEEYGDYQRNIDGIIEHAYYHLGQIVLLKKLIINQK